jgi:hypothetical protein
MENAASKEEKAQILRRIEAIGNRDIDGLDAPRQLLAYLSSEDSEIVVTALQAAGSFVSQQELFDQVLRLAAEHGDEEVRSMASSCLGNVIHDGLEFEDDLPEEANVPAPMVSPEFYSTVKEFLFSRVDALMESMEVRRRVLEALGYLGWKPEVRELVLRYYREAPNPWVKVSAIYAMGLVRDPVFERIVLEELWNENDDVLVEAAHASHTLQLHAAEPRLLELTRHTSLDVRYEAVVALGSVGDPAKLPALLRQIELENPGSEDMAEALEHARSVVKQRRMLDRGESIWDDHLVLSEIDEMLENPGNG